MSSRSEPRSRFPSVPWHLQGLIFLPGHFPPVRLLGRFLSALWASAGTALHRGRCCWCPRHLTPHYGCLHPSLSGLCVLRVTLSRSQLQGDRSHGCFAPLCVPTVGHLVGPHQTLSGEGTKASGSDMTSFRIRLNQMNLSARFGHFDLQRLRSPGTETFLELSFFGGEAPSLGNDRLVSGEGGCGPSAISQDPLLFSPLAVNLPRPSRFHAERGFVCALK